MEAYYAWCTGKAGAGMVLLLSVFMLLCLAASPVRAEKVALSDNELADVTGQALIDLQKVTGTGGTGGTAGMTFYTIGLDADINLNLNIQQLKLGCNGINGLGGCDINISNLSMGCAVNASGSCITPTSSCVTTGGSSYCTASSDQTAVALEPLLLHNPFLQIAISNDSTPATRQLAGFRLGAAQITGPLSLGNVSSFSGYLSGSAVVNMEGETGVGATCQAPSTCTGTAQSSGAPGNYSGGCGAFGCAWVVGPTSTGQSQYTTAPAYLGLHDDFACINLALGSLCEPYDALTVQYNCSLSSSSSVTGPGCATGTGAGSGVTQTGSVVLSGNRQQQAYISGLMLGTDVKEIVNSLSFTSAKGAIPAGLLDVLIGVLKPTLENNIANQLATGLQLPTSTNTTTVESELDSYQLPYNASLLHQVMLGSGSGGSNAFGLSFENQSIQYPGYASAVSRGWAMYLPNAFTLNIQQPVSLFVSNIVGGAAYAGNIVGLPGPYMNCYGGSTFC